MLNTLWKTILILFFLQVPANAETHAKAILAFSRGDYVSASLIWTALAEQGDAKSQFNIAIMAENGFGIDVNFEKSLILYGLADSQNDSFAAFNLGLIYFSGSGVSKDVARGIKYLESAAQAGDILAQYKLGQIYELGIATHKVTDPGKN